MFRRRPSLLLLTALLLLVIAPRAFTQSAKPDPTIDAIRQELMQLPYYGVFDFLSFSYEKGTVAVYGFAYHPGLKADAERAVKRASRVDQVVNKIEDLSPSQLDDDLRWQVYYAIYRDPFLSRYAPGGGTLWGHRHNYNGPFGRFGPARFPGTEPAGNFPIHIVVKGLRVTLLGVVDNEGDKNLAGIKARGVSGSLGLENELMAERAK